MRGILIGGQRRKIKDTGGAIVHNSLKRWVVSMSVGGIIALTCGGTLQCIGRMVIKGGAIEDTASS